MKKKYIKPILETEEILERLALTCTKGEATDRSGNCNGGALSS